MFPRKDQEEARGFLSLPAEAGRTVRRANVGSEKIAANGREASALTGTTRSIPKQSTEQGLAGITARAVAVARAAAEEPTVRTVRTRATDAESLEKSTQTSAFAAENLLLLVVSRLSRTRQRRLPRREMRKAEKQEAAESKTVRRSCQLPTGPSRVIRSSRSLMVERTSALRR